MSKLNVVKYLVHTMNNIFTVIGSSEQFVQAITQYRQIELIQLVVQVN